MSTLRAISLLTAALVLSSCGDKVPESEAAKRIGQQPKKTVDGVSSKVNNLMQQSGQDSERLKEGDK